MSKTHKDDPDYDSMKVKKVVRAKRQIGDFADLYCDANGRTVSDADPGL